MISVSQIAFQNRQMLQRITYTNSFIPRLAQPVHHNGVHQLH